MNIITIDLEDWFHLLEYAETSDMVKWNDFESRIQYATQIILRILNDNQVTATFFILGWVADKYPELVKEIHEAGHHIGSHSYAHELVHQQTAERFEDDLRASCYSISSITNEKVDSFRAPGFSITDDALWAFRILAENEIKYDASMFTATRSHGGMASLNVLEPSILKVGDLQLKEFPMSYLQIFKRKFVFSGGGYLRVTPCYLMKFFASVSHYNMVYVHPRDFDFGQPRLTNLSLLRYFKTYIGLSTTAEKFSYLTTRNAMSIKESDDLINWNLTEKIHV